MRRSAAATAVALLLLSGCSRDPAANDTEPTGGDAQQDAGQNRDEADPAAEPDDDPEDTSEATEPDEASDAQADLPPVDVDDIAEFYGDELEELGVSLAERGGLIDRSDGYELSETGTHLALYLAPDQPRSDEEYLEGIIDAGAAFADVFDRWPGLTSYDVCQERHPDDPLADSQLVATQMELTPEATRAIDWQSAELTDVFLAVEADEDSLLRAFGELGRDERLLGARQDARDELGDDAVSGWNS